LFLHGVQRPSLRMTNDLGLYCVLVYAFQACSDSIVLAFVKIYINTQFAAVFPIFTQLY
jgi:hypothetical protein